ncbi:MAG: hypothetical protein ACTHLU_08170 [Novosphingobium sp.]
MSQARLPLALLILTATAGADPVVAQPLGGGWGGAGWGRPGWDRGPGPARHGGADSREGKVQVSRFLAEDIDVRVLGHGPIGVSAMPGGTGDARSAATFEAAVVDQLARAGYDTITQTAGSGQVAEVRVIHDVVRAEETKRNPVSGEAMVGVSNRGSYTGLALNVDLSKPAKALVSTRLMARIKDRVTGAVLWEGRADIITRDGDDRWTEQAIATRLAAALFEDFPVRG